VPLLFRYSDDCAPVSALLLFLPISFCPSVLTFYS